MNLEDVILKIAKGNLSSPEFGQRTDALIANLYALGGQIRVMLDAIAADPRNFQVPSE
ncbi:hypothetical protein [Neotabrizicola shimadae]|uniref:Uncharacterized protein n=1 Tax=Neotabrizicola shimadae TaxID=2807096 RepID=A0A8G0ZUH4_9RHOB|nr:hypothetical protein [Neotabrizicola shimadae]QYZ68865.1 hypothetical protein JO391_13995 [Neotabrizicola shimadae]